MVADWTSHKVTQKCSGLTTKCQPNDGVGSRQAASFPKRDPVELGNICFRGPGESGGGKGRSGGKGGIPFPSLGGHSGGL